MDIPIEKKFCLTIDEAAAYFNIGTDKLRELAKIYADSLVFRVGKKQLIKREKFQDFVNATSGI